MNVKRTRSIRPLVKYSIIYLSSSLLDHPIYNYPANGFVSATAFPVIQMASRSTAWVKPPSSHELAVSAITHYFEEVIILRLHASANQRYVSVASAEILGDTCSLNSVKTW